MDRRSALARTLEPRATHAAYAESFEPSDDGRIADLFRLVDSGDYDVLSLDVFDTVVHREAVRPLDVFIELGRVLRERGGFLPSSSIESFARERQMAEGRARGKVAGHECTLAQIWDEFPRGYLTGVTAAEAMRMELQTERAHLRVYEPMRALIERAKSRGLQVAFVSDTYFTRAQIEQLTGLRPDHLMVSCEHGRPKALGLHRVLIEKTGIEPARILHAGDDRTADVEGPGSLGLARYWFRRFPDGFEDSLKRELPGSLSQRAPLVEHGDFGLTALRSHAMAAVHDDHARWGAGVLGPVVTAYAEWVAQRCEALGIDTVFCLMREGRVLQQVFSRLHFTLATHEVFVSRFVALQASLFEGSEREIRRFIQRPSASRASKLYGQLGLTAADFPGLDEQRLLEPGEIAGFARAIAASPVLRRKVVTMSAAVRKRLLAHLKPMLPAGRQRSVALVDLGYKGTIQAGLQRVFDHDHVGVRTHGLYLVTGGDVHETQADGAAVEGWLAENGQPAAMAHTFMRSPEIFEQSLMADCGTTLGHEDDGSPRLDVPHIPVVQRAQIAQVQHGVLTFADRWAAYRAEHGPAQPEALRGLCRAITERTIARPLEKELELFSAWQHDENFGSGEARSLVSVSGLHEWERAHLSAHQLASLPHSRVYWPFGFAWQQSRATGEAVAHLFLRSAEPAAFEHPAGAQPLTFFWDDGSGFRDEASATDEAVLDARGRAWHRATLQLRGEPLQAVAVALGQPGDVLRIAGVRAHWRSETGVVTHTDCAGESLVYSGFTEIAPGLVRATGTPALFVAPLAAPEAFRGDVDIDLFFTLLPEA